MDKNLVHINWEDIQKYSEEDISYFLFLEGKSIEAISKIRNMDKTSVQRHIVEGKIKYRFLAKSSSIEDLFQKVSSAVKDDRSLFLKNLNLDLKKELVRYIRENYGDMPPKSKEKAVWILGELKDGEDILIKASVHKFINIRRLSISAMGKLESSNFEIPLIRALEDENPQVVLYAVKALTKIKSQKAVPKLKVIEKKSDKEYIKNAIKDFFSNL
ncbi:HEAT repeat domain-containing protein [Haloimpatiens sp. FM7315]|uniref:HEAT repeat domain-containing protein n=1 Tax=Haloimpatiens sp. FM7315 TaxID=3298609 RepID=UPI00370CCF2A